MLLSIKYHQATPENLYLILSHIDRLVKLLVMLGWVIRPKAAIDVEIIFMQL